MVAEVEQYVNSIVPVENGTASTIIDGVFQSVDSAMQDNTSAVVGEGILTTYGGAEAGTTNANSTATTNGFDFNYLDELINGVYETDVFGNVITTTAFDYEQYTTTEESIIEKTVETVKENPEIVAAPTGLIAVGAFAGYLLTKKHRDSEAYSENEDEDTEN